MASGFLQDPILSILHKFLSYAISGNYEANKVNLVELFLLHCAVTNTKVCTSAFLFETFKNILQNSRCRPTLPMVVTALARHFKVLSADDDIPARDIIFCTRINYSELKHSHIIAPNRTWYHSANRSCVRHHLNELAAKGTTATGSSRGTRRVRQRVEEDSDDDDEEEEDDYEDGADDSMPDVSAPGPSRGSRAHHAESSSGDLSQLCADIRAFRDDFGTFRTDVFSRLTEQDRRIDAQTLRQDRMEQQIEDHHAYWAEQNRLWQAANDQGTLQYQQMMENNRQVAELNQQWSNWALFNTDHSSTPPPDQQ